MFTDDYYQESKFELTYQKSISLWRYIVKNIVNHSWRTFEEKNCDICCVYNTVPLPPICAKANPLNPGTVLVNRNRKQLKSLNLVEIGRGKRVFRSVGVYVCEGSIKRWLLLPRQHLSPISPLTLSPQHLLVTITAISYLLIITITPSVPLFMLLSLSLSLHMPVYPSTVQKSRFASYSVSPSTQLFILMSAHLSFCLHTCAC